MLLMNKEAKLIIQYFGSVPAIAEALDVSRHAIYQWKKVPQLRAYELEELMNNAMERSSILRANFTSHPPLKSK